MLAQLCIFAAMAFGLPVDKDHTSAATRLRNLEADLAAADAAYEKASSRSPQHAGSEAAARQSSEALAKRRATAFAGALAIAKEDPTSEAGFDSLEWLLMHAPQVYRYPEGKDALDMMTRYYAADPRVAKAIGKIALHPPVGLPLPQNETHVAYSPAYAPAMNLLKAVAKLNGGRDARAQAAMGQAMQTAYACEFTDYRRKPAAHLRADAVAALQAVMNEYADVPCIGVSKYTPTLADRARIELFQLQKLRPGETAPEIAGEDLNGQKLRLSDYRGKVVILVFWASWCGPCMAEVPHERELLDRFKGKPFDIIGVNGDEEKAKALAAAAASHITWRSFWNGPDGAYGPLNTAWNIRSLPTVYLIDRKGVIRSNAADINDLDAQVPVLLGEAEAHSPANPGQ